MKDLEIREMFNISSEEYYEAMEGFEEWYSSIASDVECEPFN